MKVAPLRYDVIFKKAFSDPELFTALAKDFLHLDNLEIDEVENDKAFYPVVGNVNFKFDLFAEDKKNRVIIEMQHAHYTDSFERFLYYQCCAMVETIASSKNYQFPVTVITLVFFTKKRTPSSDSGILTLDFQMRDSYNGKVIEKVFGKHKHQLVFVFTTESHYASEECEQWILAIDESLRGEVSPESYENPYIKRMFEKIKEDNITPEERAKMKEEYNQEEAQMTALQEGEKKGLEKAARNLLALGTLSVEQIANVTGLSLERVKELSASFRG
jgi:predicted transposase/invertase (TIGR01784 family)